MTGLNWFIGVFSKPGKTFGEMGDRRAPFFLIPLMLLLTLKIASSFIFQSRADMETVIRNTLLENRLTANMTEEQIDMIVSKSSSQDSVAAIAISIGGFVVIFGLLFLFYWLILMAFGITLSFPSVANVVGFSFSPKIIYSALTCLIFYIKDPTFLDPKNPITSNMGAIIGKTNLHPALYTFLSNVDIFTIWVAILLTIGFAAASKSKNLKVTGAIVGAALLFGILVQVAWSAIFGMKVSS